MSRDYAMSRVRDALEKENGNHLKAQRLLMDWLAKDQTLLLGLVAPHLNGIVAHALNHASSTPDTKKAHMPAEVEIEKELPPTKASQRHIDAIHAIVNAGKSDDKK